MTKERQLVYRYLSLPYYLQMVVARYCNLLHDDDEKLDKQTLCIKIFERVKKNKVLKFFETKVNEEHEKMAH